MLTLEQYDRRVARHLHMIEAGIEVCERHVDQLVFRPNFETICEIDMARVEEVLAQALRRIHDAQRKYYGKKIDGQA